MELPEAVRAAATEVFGDEGLARAAADAEDFLVQAHGYISKGIRRQGIGSSVRNSNVSKLCPVVICPRLCTSDRRAGG